MLSPSAWYNGNVIDKKLSQYFSAMGRKSVKARLKKLTKKQRQEIARNAAKVRWTCPVAVIEGYVFTRKRVPDHVLQHMPWQLALGVYS
jgi:hypothetical protein